MGCSTTFVPGKGIQLNNGLSHVKYLLPQTITNGEFSMDVEGLRANAPGDGLGGGLALSPDLTVHDASFTCAGGGATIAVELCNRGTEPVADGLAFTVYAGKPPTAPVACTALTTVDIFPGQCIS